MAQGKVVLLACGSFNPPTYMHLRMFEIAREHLQAMGTQVVGGVMSPVHDAYAKKDLASAQHRCAMVRLALRSSDWVKLSEWEVQQEGWSRTRRSLQHHQEILDRHVRSPGCGDGGGDDDAPAWLPDDILNENRSPDQPDNMHPATNHNIWVERNGSGGGGHVTVKLLCGADLLESFATPGLWADEDLEAILGNHGLVVVSRAGADPARFIYESDILYRYRRNVTLVTNWVTNEVSSTALRRLLRRGLSIKYLTDDAVASYACAHRLYGAADTEYSPTRLGGSPRDVAMLTPDTPLETDYKNILISIRDRPSIVDETITVTKRARKTNFILPYAHTDSVSAARGAAPKMAYLDAASASFVPGKAVKVVGGASKTRTVVDEREVSSIDPTEFSCSDGCVSAENESRYKRRVSAGNVESDENLNVASTDRKSVGWRSLGGTMKKIEKKKEMFSMGSIKKSLSEVARLSHKVKDRLTKEKETERDYKTRSCNDIVKLVLTKHGIHVISDTEAIV